jgi:hypothetical protein
VRKQYHSELEADGMAWSVEGRIDEGHLTADVVAASQSDGTVGLELRIDGDRSHLDRLAGIVAELQGSLLGAPPPRSSGGQRLAAIREGLPRAYTPWTEADEKLLLERWDVGDAVELIAQQLERGAGGVRSRLVRLGRIDEAG